MIRVVRFNKVENAIVSGGQELLDGWTPDGDDIIWVDLDQPDLEFERKLLDEQFRIDPLAIDDAQRERHPPKLEWFNNYFFLLLKGFTADTDSIDFSVVHISLFVGRNFLVSRHAQTSPSIDQVLDRVSIDEVDVKAGSAHLCYRVVRTIIDRYTPIVLSLEGRLDELEEQMLEDPSDELLGELVIYNSRLKKLRRIFGYQQAMLGEFDHAETELIPERGRHEYRDIFEQMERLASLSAMLQELTRDLIDGYISISSHRLNNIMKILTIASVIFLPMTFIAGIYGMNFENMPELGSQYGYFIVLGVLVGLGGGLLAVFRRMRWI